MKALTLVYEKYNLLYFSLILIVVILPFPIRYANIALVISLIVWLLSLNRSSLGSLQESKKYIYILAAPFILPLLGMFHTSNLKEGFSILERSIPLLALPILLFSKRKLEIQQLSNILKSFIGAIFISITVCILVAFYRNSQIDYGIEWNLFTREMTFIVGFSHVYFGLYASLAFLIINYFFLTSQEKSLLKYALYYFFSTALLIFILLITAKIAFLATALLWLSLPIVLKNKKIVLINASAIVISSFAIFFLVKNVPYINFRFSQVKVYDINKIDNDKDNYASTRTGPIRCSIEIIKGNWLLGVGTGDEKDELDNCYNHRNLNNLVGLDAHNQFFSFFIRYGLIGFCLFVGMLLFLFLKTIELKQPLYFLFLALFSICCISENILDSNKGIMFFAFFNTLFASIYLRDAVR